MARHCEPPPYRDRLLDGRVPAIECVCRDKVRSGADVASAAAHGQAQARAPTCTTVMLAARERPLLRLIGVPSSGGRAPGGCRGLHREIPDGGLRFWPTRCCGFPRFDAQRRATTLVAFL